MSVASAVHTRAVEVDTVLARIYGDRAKVSATISSALDSVHYALGERTIYRGRAATFPTTNVEAEATFRERVASGAFPSYDQRSHERLLAKIDAARAQWTALDAEAKPLNAEFAASPWSRFFLVTNNGGHVHSSMSCSTCRITTEFAWLPTLSGLTEAEAVAEHGPILCTVCFPSAPVEWTIGKAKPAGCEGSGTYVEYTYAVNARGDRRATNTRYVVCPVCGESAARTSTGMTRKHKPKG